MNFSYSNSFRNCFFRSFNKSFYNNKFNLNMLKSNTNSARFMTAFSNKYFMTKINHMKLDNTLSANFESLSTLSSAMALDEVANAEEGLISQLTARGNN